MSPAHQVVHLAQEALLAEAADHSHALHGHILPAGAARDLQDHHPPALAQGHAGHHSRPVGEDLVGDPVSTMKCFSAVCRTSSGKTTYLQGRGQGGRRVTAGAGGRTPELGAVDGCAFFSGAGPGLL